jgi:group II intron reverse transcriptase/maturase
MIGQVLHPYNLQKALEQVIVNKGSAGIDGMKTTELTEYLRENKLHIFQRVKQGKYRPQAILGVEIPKPNGKSRLLGIPTVTDRLLQQAVSQVVMPKFENGFSAYSYGFRPNRNARQAVGKALEYIHEGYGFIVDIDLKTFFDEVDHCLLLNLLYQKVKCPITLQLIRKWLRAPILINGKLEKRRKGVPQGSPISPLLSNILLNELDKELTRRKLRFVRYADDFSIYTRRRGDVTATMGAISKYLKTKLKLTVNREKSGVRKPVQFTILGFGFVPTYIKGEKGKYQLVVSEKAWKSLKMRVKTITAKTKPMSFDERVAKINEIQRGWLNYFRGTSIHGKLRDLDGWLRNRLRYCIWTDWKKPERKRKNLIRLGVDQDHAYAWSRTRKGGWAVAQSPILNSTITLKRLQQRGYQAMLRLYMELNPSIYEPPYTCPFHSGGRDPYVRWCERRTQSVNCGAVYSIIITSIIFLILPCQQ